MHLYIKVLSLPYVFSEAAPLFPQFASWASSHGQTDCLNDQNNLICLHSKFHCYSHPLLDLLINQDHAEFVINIDEFKFAGGEGNTQFGSDVTDSSTHPQLKSRLWQLWREGQLRKQLVEGNGEHSPPICPRLPAFLLCVFLFVCLFSIFAGAGMSKFFRVLDLKSGLQLVQNLHPAT